MQTAVSNQTVISAFWVKGTFGVINLEELGAYFGDEVLAMRNTVTGLPITNASLYDIRVDLTITHDQA